MKDKNNLLNHLVSTRLYINEYEKLKKEIKEEDTTVSIKLRKIIEGYYNGKNQ